MTELKNITQDSSVALISNTLVCEASRILSANEAVDDEAPMLRGHSRGLYGSRVDAWRLVDLMTVVEAVILHDTLATLPGRLGSKAKDPPLRHELLKHGVLKEIDTSRFHEEISRLLVNSLAQISNPVRVAGAAHEIGTPIDFDARIRKEIEDFFLFSDRPLHINDIYDFYGEGGGSSEPLYANSYEDMGRSLIGWIEYHGSGAYEFCTSILRDMYYIVTAEHMALPYWPQFSRIEFSKLFPNFFDRSFRLQLYSKLAKALESAVAEVFDDLNQDVALIPPFTSIVLERSNKPEDIIEQIFVVRDEYSGLRRALTHLEHQQQNAKSLKERKQIRLQQKRLLEQAASSFERPASVALQNILRYIPEVLRPALAPTDATRYSADLLLKPVDWVVAWWQRRPVSKLFDLTRRIESIEDYHRLIQKVFGNRSDEISSLDWKYIRWCITHGRPRLP